MSLIILQVFPSLLGYIIVLAILTVLLVPYSRSTIFDDQLSLHRFPHLIVLPRTTNLIPSLCHICGSNNLLLHQSFLLDAVADQLLLRGSSRQQIVVIIINILTPSRISIEFMMRNTILALDDLCYYQPLYFLPFNTNLFMFCVIP